MTARLAGALERGPLVDALEQADQSAGAVLDDLRVLAESRIEAVRGPGVVQNDVAVRFDAVQSGRGPSSDRTVSVTAIPDLERANRGAGPMRVWLHRA